MRVILSIFLILQTFQIQAGCDLSGGKIENCDFSNKDFEQFDFSNKELSKIRFDNSNLFGALFNKTKIKSVSFKNVNLFGAFFVGSTLENVNFTGSDISGADFTGSTIKHVDFSNAVQEDTIFGEITKKSKNPIIVKSGNCKIVVDYKDRLSWSAVVLRYHLEGQDDPDKFILDFLCKSHKSGKYSLRNISSHDKKTKFTFSYNNCSFPVDLWIKKESIYIESFYNPSCNKSDSINTNNPKFILVNIECISAGSCFTSNLKISGGPGNFDLDGSGSGGGIHKGYNGSLAGHYNWSSKVDLITTITKPCYGG